MAASDWTVVTVTYNSRVDLERYWRDRVVSEFHWIVVDNASSDGTSEAAAALGAEVLSLPVNVGFGAANNVGLGAARSRYVAFVNPDVRGDLPGLETLEQTIKTTQGIVGPQLVGEDGSAQPNGRGFPFLSDKLAHRGVRIPGSNLDRYLIVPATHSPTHVAWLMGAAVCARRDVFDLLGGWNDDYFIYYEDHELGLRAWSQEVPVVLDPRVQWVHAWNRATTRPSVQHWRHELASARVFFRTYPEFLAPTRGRADRRHATAARLVGRALKEEAL
jgi:N-acetylglucosaminyl-diphospho-decaprenol L-rhamnosyltransferase